MIVRPDLTPARRRRLVARCLLEAFASAAVLVWLYYALPVDMITDAGSVAVLAIGLIGVAALVGWQVRQIVKARYPAIRAIQALAMTVPLFLLLFAMTYYLVERSSPSSFTEHMSRTDALYFTVTTFATVGFGVKVFLGAAQRGRQRQEQGASDEALLPPAPAAPEVGPEGLSAGPQS